MGQALTRRPLIAVAWVRSQVSPCEGCCVDSVPPLSVAISPVTAICGVTGLLCCF